MDCLLLAIDKVYQGLEAVSRLGGLTMWYRHWKNVR